LRTTGVDFYNDDAMRLFVTLASFVAVLGVTTPVQADPALQGPIRVFWRHSPRPALRSRIQLSPSPLPLPCALMDQGNSQAGVIKSVSSSNPGFSRDGAAKFTMIAASAYCPQHMG
jgi:Protein of unknown function (DUF732)